MTMVISSIVTGIVCYILGLGTSRRLAQEIKNHGTSDRELLGVVVEEERLQFLKTLQDLVATVEAGSLKMHSALVSDIRDKKAEAEGQIQAALEAQVAQVDKAATDSLDEAKARRDEMNQDIESQVARAAEEYKRLDAIFRKSQDSDATRSLMSAAYALVASNKPTRDHLDSELTNAVIRHRKEGGPMVPKSDLSDSIPEGKDLN